MTKEVTVVSDTTQAFLQAVEQESNQGGQQAFCPSLIVVQEMGVTTPSGEDVPMGAFHIPDTEYFAKEVTIRPIFAPMKLMSRAGVEDNYKVLNESIYFTGWREEILDRLGTTGCGRVFGKVAKELSPEEQELNKKKATLYTHIYALVTFPKEEPQLVRFSVSGGKMMRWSGATNSSALGKIKYQQLDFKLSLVLPSKDPQLPAAERKNASNKYFNLIVEPDMSTIHPLEDIQEVGGEVFAHVSSYNADVVEDHFRSTKVAVIEGSGTTEAEFEELTEAIEQLA